MLTPNELVAHYSNFVFGMSDEHFNKYMQLPVYRRDYLFNLWLVKQGHN